MTNRQPKMFEKQSAARSSLPQFQDNKYATYRPDIDGLRAVAIVSVVIFHAYPIVLPGGFIGVDIFFVISGYLISNIIFGGMSRGNFSFTKFYAHRIIRIFPALATVLFTSLVLGWFILLPDEYKQLGKHVAAGAGFFQNFSLLKESGYFNTASELKPLMHLWSLAVEEQFYLIYPLIVFLFWRSKFNILVVVFVFGLVSFVSNIYGVRVDAVETFFAPQTRFWEMLAGGGVSAFQLFQGLGSKTWIVLFRLSPEFTNRLVSHRFPVVFLNNTYSVGGFLLVFLALFLVGSDKLFPGWWALMPVLGAVFIILAGPGGWINRNILASRFMIFLGLISYPLYLWHWPILSFSRIVESGDLSVGFRFVLMGLSFIFAWLTYLLVEKPIRNGRRNIAKTGAMLLIVTLIGLAGHKVFARDGFGFRFKDRMEFSNFFENNPPTLNYVVKHGLMEAYREDCNFYDIRAFMTGHPTPVARTSISPSCYIPTANVAVLIWGDSHAQQLYHGLRVSLSQDISVLQVASSGCSPQYGEKAKLESDYCQKSNSFAINVIKKISPKIVIIAQQVKHDEVNDYHEIFKALKDAGVKNVLLIGPVPQWQMPLYKLIEKKFWIFTPRKTFDGLIPGIFEVDKQLKERYKNTFDGVEYVSMIDFFCDASGCLTYIGSDRREGLVTFDYGHFTVGTSEYVGKDLLAPKILEVLARSSGK